MSKEENLLQLDDEVAVFTMFPESFAYAPLMETCELEAMVEPEIPNLLSVMELFMMVDIETMTRQKYWH